jgi:hypothetical protein
MQEVPQSLSDCVLQYTQQKLSIAIIRLVLTLLLFKGFLKTGPLEYFFFHSFEYVFKFKNLNLLRVI